MIGHPGRLSSCAVLMLCCALPAEAAHILVDVGHAPARAAGPNTCTTGTWLLRWPARWRPWATG